MATLHTSGSHRPTIASCVRAATPNDATHLPGVITASLTTIIVVSAFIGGFAGMLFDDVLAPSALAITAGFLGTVTAGATLNSIFSHAWTGERFGTAIDIVTMAAVTSLLGGLASHQIVTATGPIWSGVTGMLAGILSAVLLGTLMTAAHKEEDPVGEDTH